MRDGLFDLIFMFLPKFYGFFFLSFRKQTEASSTRIVRVIVYGFW